MDKNAKQKRAEKAKAEEAALNRILCWIVGGVALEFLVLLLARYVVYYKVAEYTIHVVVSTAAKILAVAGLACAAGAAYWWNSARKSGKGVNLSGALCLFMLGLSASCFDTCRGGSGPHLLSLSAGVFLHRLPEHSGSAGRLAV